MRPAQWVRPKSDRQAGGEARATGSLTSDPAPERNDQPPADQPDQPGPVSGKCRGSCCPPPSLFLTLAAWGQVHSTNATSAWAARGHLGAAAQKTFGFVPTATALCHPYATVWALSLLHPHKAGHLSPRRLPQVWAFLVRPLPCTQLQRCAEFSDISQDIITYRLLTITFSAQNWAVGEGSCPISQQFKY